MTIVTMAMEWEVQSHPAYFLPSEFPPVMEEVEEDNRFGQLLHLPAEPKRSTTVAIVPRTPHEWNIHRGLITRLYRDMELPLKEVQRVMETEHHFKAT